MIGSDVNSALEAVHRDKNRKSRDPFARAYDFTLARDLRKASMNPYFLPVDRNDGTEAVFEGQRVLMFGSNNYLGLTVDPRVREAAAQALRELGPSMTGSRLLNGSGGFHEAFEAEIADFLGTEAALVFTTGYQANLGVLTALAGRETTVAYDRLDHASIQDAVKMAQARRLRFAHNDTRDLERQLAELPEEEPVIVIEDGVFSMEGDLAPLPRLAAICHDRGARLVVDDAHGIGVMGPGGRGTAAHFDVESRVDLTVGTFSKSLASIGGFVAGDEAVIDYIRYFGRSMVFTASASPPAVAAARTALVILRQEPERVRRLHANARCLREGLASAGFDVGQTRTPIIPVHVGDEMTSMMYWRRLIDRGVYTSPVMYPAVPMGDAVLRYSVTSEHTTEQIHRAVETMDTLARELRLPRSA